MLTLDLDRGDVLFFLYFVGLFVVVSWSAGNVRGLREVQEFRKESNGNCELLR